MDTLDRYLVKEFIFFFLVIWVGLATLYLGIDFFSKVWDMDMPTEKIIAVYLYRVPGALQLFVPVASLMATLLLLTNMSRQNEILALYGGGIGVLRITSSFVAIVSIVCTCSFLTFDRLTPLFVKKHDLLLQGKDPSQDNVPTYAQGKFWYRSGPLLYNVGNFSPEQSTLKDINAYLLSSHYRLVQRIHAKQAFFDGTEWILQDGFLVTYPDTSPFPASASFTEKRGVIPEKPEDFKTLKIYEETMPLKELRQLIRRNKAYGLDTVTQEVNYQERLALVFTPLLFVLMGIPFATNPMRHHSMARSIGFCFFLVFAYLLLSKFFLSLGKSAYLPPLIAGWTPNVLVTGYAVFKLLQRKK